MSDMLQNLNLKWREKGLPELKIGVGINTGEMIVGNIGSNARFNYTVIGDEVNFASRLESLNKTYGTECIVSESTRKEIGDAKFKFRELDLVTVKGKTEPKLIFELITRSVDDALIKILKEFDLGRKLYEAGDFKNAVSHFGNALAIGEDGPSKVFLERCQFLEKNRPENWNGVYEFKTK
jgi:adenylate cyclase